MLSLPVPEPRPADPLRHWRRDAWISTVALAVIIGWDFSGLDLVTEHWFGTATGFALRDHWLWSTLLHTDARRLAWALQLALLLSIWWPYGVLRTLSQRERTAVFVTAMAILVVISGLKTQSSTSCPWDLAEFGGMARYVSHWHWGVRDGGAGHCFPAGHVSAALCFLPGYLWLRERAPGPARVWLACTLLAALTIGLAQQVRGAHYFSHTLWAAWISWMIALLGHRLLRGRQG